MRVSVPTPKDLAAVENSAIATTGIGAILRKHGRVLTVIGALIVFLTFIVKEERGEALKSLTDSIGTAETLFALQTDINNLHQAQIISQHTIQDRLAENDIHTLTAEAMSDEHERDSGTIEEDKIAAVKERWHQNIESAQAYDKSAELLLARALNFTQKLQPDDALTRELDAELNQREEERQAHQGSIGAVSKAIDSYRLKRTGQGKPVYTDHGGVMTFQIESDMGSEVIAKTSRQLAIQGKALSDAVDTTIRRVFEQADKISRRNEEAYQNTKHWAVSLYVLGWALGLLGKVYDVKGLSGGE